MHVRILCGVSGSGKSTLANQESFLNRALLCSADTFMMEDGVYNFSAAKLPHAHAACLKKFVEALQAGVMSIVVDNTNTTVAEVAPYAALALAYGATLMITTVECDPEIAAARNAHGVPLAGVQAQAARLAERSLPPWWPQETIKTFEGHTVLKGD